MFTPIINDQYVVFYLLLRTSCIFIKGVTRKTILMLIDRHTILIELMSVDLFI